MSDPGGLPHPLQLRTLEDVIGYCHGHEGAARALWNQQIKFNDDVTKRIRLLEFRVLILACLGGLIGASARDIFGAIAPAAVAVGLPVP